MRALRDFNLPKIVTEDVPIFMGLIGDLFPALDVPRMRDLKFEDWVKKSITVSMNTLYACMCCTYVYTLYACTVHTYIHTYVHVTYASVRTSSTCTSAS